MHSFLSKMYIKHFSRTMAKDYKISFPSEWICFFVLFCFHHWLHLIFSLVIGLLMNCFYPCGPNLYRGWVTCSTSTYLNENSRQACWFWCQCQPCCFLPCIQSVQPSLQWASKSKKYLHYDLLPDYSLVIVKNSRETKIIDNLYYLLCTRLNTLGTLSHLKLWTAIWVRIFIMPIL